MAESGGAERIKRNRKSKTPEKEDRFSALPDSLLHRILSFLPSTKEAIQTGILSKRWKNQWTHVSNLIFDFYDMSSDYSFKKIPSITSTISSIIDRVLILHDCCKLQKFHIRSGLHYDFAKDFNCDVKLRFAIRKQVEDLQLYFSMKEKFMLPDFFFRQDSLLNLRLCDCIVMPVEMVHWGNLTDLYLENCCYPGEALRSILSGCPLLQSLEIRHRGWRHREPRRYQSNQLVISSTSLKRLFLQNIDCGFESFDIWCPKLVEFVALAFMRQSLALEKLLSDSPLLESLTLKTYRFPNLRICSEVLKKLTLYDAVSSEIEISCPNLEKLELAGLAVETIRSMNLPCSVSASLDSNITYKGCKKEAAKQILEQLHNVKDLELGSSFLEFEFNTSASLDSNITYKGCKKEAAKQILEQLHNVKDLELGSSFLEILSGLLMSALPCPSLNGKFLSLRSSSFEHIPRIVFALCNSPVLERLVILEPDKSQELSDLNCSEDNYWNSHETHFGNLVSRLKIVRIIGLSKRVGKPKLVLDFVEFLLKNAIVLENISVDVEGCGTGFMLQVSQKLLSFPRHSKAAIEFFYK